MSRIIACPQKPVKGRKSKTEENGDKQRIVKKNKNNSEYYRMRQVDIFRGFEYDSSCGLALDKQEC